MPGGDPGLGRRGKHVRDAAKYGHDLSPHRGAWAASTSPYRTGSVIGQPPFRWERHTGYSRGSGWADGPTNNPKRSGRNVHPPLDPSRCPRCHRPHPHHVGGSPPIRRRRLRAAPRVRFGSPPETPLPRGGAARRAASASPRLLSHDRLAALGVGPGRRGRPGGHRPGTRPPDGRPGRP